VGDIQSNRFDICFFSHYNFVYLFIFNFFRMIATQKYKVAKMETTAVVGTQWGDEGKGRIIDLLAQSSDAVVRFQGGGNAGHTIVNDEGKFVSHLLPSGIFTKGTKNILGPGMVIEPQALLKELNNFIDCIVQCGDVFVSDRAHVVLSLHKRIEAALDNRSGSLKYGSA